MDKREGSSTNFMPGDLLEVICILERGKKYNSYKIIRKRNYFSLITKFPAKNGESTPLKNCASARGTATHQDPLKKSSGKTARFACNNYRDRSPVSGWPIT